MSQPATDDLQALAKGGRTNVMGFVIRLAGRIPFLVIAGRYYGAEITGRFALAVLVKYRALKRAMKVGCSARTFWKAEPAIW